MMPFLSGPTTFCHVTVISVELLFTPDTLCGAAVGTKVDISSEINNVNLVHCGKDLLVSKYDKIFQTDLEYASFKCLYICTYKYKMYLVIAFYILQARTLQ